MHCQKAHGRDRERATEVGGGHVKKCEGCCDCYLLSGVGRLSDCDSNLAKTTFIVRQTDGLRAKASL